MIFFETSWIRSNKRKFCPMLRKYALEWYRPHNRLPCFLQKYYKYFKQHWRKIPIIVQTEETHKMEYSMKTLAKSSGCSIKKNFPMINAFSTKVTAKSLELLVKNNHVKKVWYDREVRAILDVASPTVKSSSLWNSNITGKDIVVAILDTGIFDHPDLSGRIVAFKDFINQETSPYDDNGHGTHVAGDVASDGNQSNFKYRGPAYEAKLVGVKVLNKLGMGSLSLIIEGIQWCIDNKDTLGIKVINMSLGSEATLSYTDDPICQAVGLAWNSGIVVCVAAGNSGPEARTISSPGIHPSVITVGALDDANTISPENDQVADFSSRGPTIDNLIKPDVLSPGVDIISLRSPGSLLDKQNKQSRVNSSYFSLSGTSMATPICSGVVAQILQKMIENNKLPSDPNKVPDEVKMLLINSAKPFPNIDPNIQGYGVIDAEKAIEDLSEDE